MNKKIFFITFLIFSFMFVSACTRQEEVNKIEYNQGSNLETNNNQNIMNNNVNKKDVINMDILEKYSQAEFKTNMGSFTIEFFNDKMPETVANFLSLAENSYFDGIKFHRVINDFMIQGGDPLTKDDTAVSMWGTGGPGYAIVDEHVSGLSNLRGTISMANSGPNSGGSQFFINLKDNTFLDFDKDPLSSKHPVFGEVIEGMETIDKIALVETNSVDRPLNPVVIESIILK